MPIENISCDPLAPAKLLLTCAGLVQSMLLFTPILISKDDFNIQTSRSKFELYSFMIMYFVGAGLGVIISSITLRKYQKHAHYTICSGICMAAGFCIMIGHQEIKPAIGGNFLAGLSFGTCLLTAIIHGSGISNKYERGSILSSLQIFIEIGSMLSFVILSIIFSQGKSLQVLDFQETIGLCYIICGLTCLILIHRLNVEAPEYLLFKGYEAKAKENFLRLRKQDVLSEYLLLEYNEIHETISNVTAYNNKLTYLIKVLLIRIAYNLGIGMPLNVVMTTVFNLFMATGTNTIIIMLTLKIIGCTIGGLFSDRVGRKKVMLFSLLASAVILIAYNAVLIKARAVNPTIVIRDSLLSLTILYQFFLGLGQGSSLALMSEIFTFDKKTVFSALVLCIENVVHIIIVMTMNLFLDNQDLYIFTTAGIQLIAFFSVGCLLPETKGRSLKEIQLMMR